MLTAQKAIEILSKLPPETRIVVTGYEAGYNDVDDIQEIDLLLNVYQERGYGEHGAIDEIPEYKRSLINQPAVKAAVIF